MTTPKCRFAFLLFVTGAMVVALSGCTCSRMTVVKAADSRSVSIHQMGGDIDVKEAPNGADLATMGGNVHLGSVGSFAKIHTMGGNITIDRADATIDASTMGGKVTISNADGPIKASTMAGDVTAHMVGTSTARRDIELSSKSGTIVLIVPKDFSMDVRITLAYTKNAGDHFRIIDHVGLTQKESDDWDISGGTPRKYIRAAGRVGSGLNRVKIDTVNGDVILKQE